MANPFKPRRSIFDFEDTGDDPFGGLSFEDPDALTPEEESFLQSLGSGGLSALETVATVLDTPGAAVRALIAGKNPLDSIFDPSQRVHGEDLIGQGDGGWGNWLASRAVEIGLDPTTYMGGFGLLGKSLGLSGRLAKSAGLLDRMATGAAKTSKAGLGTGARTRLMNTTLKDLLESVPTAERAAAKSKLEFAAGKQGVKNLDDLMEKPLGGAFQARIPFTNAEWTPSGPIAQKFAAARDAAGEAVRYGRYSPVRGAAALFDPAMRGTTDPIAQRIAGAGSASEKELTPQLLDKLYEAEGNLTRLGLRDTPPDVIRHALEFPSQADPVLVDALRPLAEANASIPARSAQMGTGLKELGDDYAQYAARQWAPEISTAGAGGKSVLGKGSEQLARKGWLRDLPGGTKQINEMGRKAADILEQGGDQREIRQMLRAEGIENTYKRGKKEVKGRRDKLANLFYGIGQEGTDYEFLKKGVFSNNPLYDALGGLQSTGRTAGGREGLLRALGDETLLKQIETNPRYAKDKLLDLDVALKKLGLPPEAMQTIADELSKQSGKQVTVQDVVNRIKLPKSLVEQLKQADAPVSGPRAANKFIEGYDQFTNLFKTFTLLHPAQYVRNLTSGQVQNAMQGQFGSQRSATALMKGRVLPDAAELAQVPAVKEALARQQLADTPENVSEVVRQMAAARQVQTPLAGDTVQATERGTLAEVSGNVPGRDPAVTPLSPQWWKTLLGMEPGTTKLPFSLGPKGSRLKGAKSNLRGVGEAKETRFGAAKAGDQAGYFIEGENRLAPFIQKLKKGIDPSRAAEDVIESQVRYKGALTPFEQEVMARLMPFYRFTKGALKGTAKELYQKPGGPLAQVLKGQQAALRSEEGQNDQPIPEHIADTLAIPLIEGGGLASVLGMPKDKDTQRYLTGLGLMQEEPLRMLGKATPGKLDELGLDLIGRTNPLIKAALELPFGTSSFQRGPEGGRPLEELDPTLGRTISNLAGLDSPVGTPGALEYAVGASPLSRLATSARVASDPRKDFLNKVVNLISGIRTTDVSPQVADATIRSELNKLMKQAGARTFQQPYFSKAAMSRMSPAERKEAEKFNAVRRLLDKRRKQRAKEREKQ